ncbi:MAG: YlbF family regulator [Phycisphaerae bacterium]
MDDQMQEIMTLAQALGRKIGAHAATRDFMAAAKAVAQNPEAQKILGAYTEHEDRIRELEANGRPIEVADKHKLAELQGQVASHDQLKAMSKAQADYVAMMQRMQTTLDAAIQEAHTPSGEG